MGYVLHNPIYSSENLPSFPASIKDGYAIKYNNNDSWSQKCHVFRVVQISLAGTEVKYLLNQLICADLYFKSKTILKFLF